MSYAGGIGGRGIAMIVTGRARNAKTGSVAMPKENDLEVRRISVANMAARRACLNPNRIQPEAMIKASCATSADRNSRATKRARSK